MKTAVVGPRGQVFLTDGHNTFTAFWQATDGGPAVHVRVRVLANVSYLNTAAFWQGMDARELAWLRDAEAQPITPDQLPTSLGLASFQNDRYYGLAYFARNIGYAKAPDAPEYLELYWGAWLRQNFDLGQYDLTSLPGYLDVLKASSQAMAGPGTERRRRVRQDGLRAGPAGDLERRRPRQRRRVRQDQPPAVGSGARQDRVRDRLRRAIGAGWFGAPLGSRLRGPRAVGAPLEISVEGAAGCGDPSVLKHLSAAVRRSCSTCVVAAERTARGRVPTAHVLLNPLLRYTLKRYLMRP